MTAENIIFTGMPGVGKSTIGEKIAIRSGREFVETDTLVEEQQRLSIGEILRYSDAAYFSQCEAEAALQIRRRQLIVSTGGSMVLHKAAMDHLKETGIVVFLDVDPVQIEKRIKGQRSRMERIVGLGSGGLLELAEFRRPYYESTCDISVKMTGLDLKEDFEKVLAAVENIL